MEFKSKTLINGLSVIGEINKSAKSAAVGFFVKTGARDERRQINGVSHFLEHMVFKGTEAHNAFEVSEAFDRMGAQFNAFTSEENTIFYSAVLPEYLEQAAELWIELMRPALRNDDFKVEKNVIKEEIAMYEDQPTFYCLDRCRRLHFDNHPCGNSVLGTVKSIEGLTAQQMRDYFYSRYVSNNMTVAFAGNFDWESLFSNVAEDCERWQQKPAHRDLSHCRGSRKNQTVKKQNLSRQHICLMSPGVSAQDNRRFACSLLAGVIGDDVGSKFFWELVDKALAETATMHFGAMDGTGVFYSYIRCSSQNAGKVLDIVKYIFKEVTDKGINEDELRKAKNKTISALVLKNELPMGRLVDVGGNWIYLGKYRTIEEDIKAVEDVTLGDINELLKEFNPGDFTQFTLVPGENT